MDTLVLTQVLSFGETMLRQTPCVDRNAEEVLSFDCFQILYRF